MTFGIPQVIYLGIMFLGLGIGMAKHGEPKEGNHSAGIIFISICIQLALLYWGGFFG